MNLKALECRKEPIKKSYYTIKQQGSSTVKTKKEKAYEFYVCDYCGDKIKIEKKFYDRTGGVYPYKVSNDKTLILALCNKCLKPVLKIINNVYGTNF